MEYYLFTRQYCFHVCFLLLMCVTVRLCFFCLSVPWKLHPWASSECPQNLDTVTHTDAALSRDHRGSHTYYVPDHRHGPILYGTQFTFFSYSETPALFLVSVSGVSDPHHVCLPDVLLSVCQSVCNSLCMELCSSRTVEVGLQRKGLLSTEWKWNVGNWNMPLIHTYLILQTGSWRIGDQSWKWSAVAMFSGGHTPVGCCYRNYAVCPLQPLVRSISRCFVGPSHY